MKHTLKRVLSLTAILVVAAVPVIAAFCPECRSKAPDDAKFCMECGKRIPTGHAHNSTSSDADAPFIFNLHGNECVDLTNYRPIRGDCNTFTISCWMYPESAKQSRVYIHRADWRDIQLIWSHSSDRRIRWAVNDDSGQDNDHQLVSGELPLNQWTHVAGTYDGQEQRLYINGKLVETQRWRGSVNWDNAFIAEGIGGHPATRSDRFVGKISGVVILSSSLDPDEIRQLSLSKDTVEYMASGRIEGVRTLVEASPSPVHSRQSSRTTNPHQSARSMLHPNDAEHLRTLGRGIRGYAGGARDGWKSASDEGVIDRTYNAVMGGSIGFAEKALSGGKNPIGTEKEVRETANMLRSMLMKSREGRTKPSR